MAKAPRRRGGRGERPRRAKPTRPPAAKPVRPPSAKPVRPPAAKPVRPPTAKPVRPPAAEPVRPTARPVAKPVGEPVSQGRAPASPAARSPGTPPRAPSGRARGGMSEEEVARPRGRRSGRSSYGGHGLGLGAKVGLLAAAATLVCVATAVFLSGPPRGEADEQLNAFGLEAASVLSAPDARWYRGGAGAAAEEAGGLGHYEKTFKDLFGKEGAEFWDRRFKELTQPIPREEEGTFQGQALQKEKKAFERTVERIRKSAGTGGAAKADLKSQLALVWNAMHTSEDGPYTVTAAWLRERVNAGKEGAWLSGNVGPNEVSYDWSGYVDAGSGFGWVDGTVQGRAVRIFTASIRGAKPADPMTGYVAVYRQPTPAGASALGLAMLLLGPLLVGLVAYAVANGHTKGIRSLAREIDRLGSSGDPDRQLHASGSEATTLARAVERMVSNLEFREKHDGDDLEEVVSREQKVAQEIHHTLISKNPPRLRDYEVETLFKPGFEIGGDHFEYFPIDETHLGIILLDTNVRGIPAALVMASAKSYVRAEAPGELSPATVLRRVNRQLAGELPPGRHVTALYVVLDTADGSATLASAGHLPLLVYRHQAGKMAKVNPEGIALGLDAGPVFDKSLQEGDIPIGVGDRIVLYTDGALRIQNAEGEEFGEQRFYGSVANEAPKNSQAFVNFVGATIDRFHLDVPQNDDITISTIKRLR